MFEFWPCIGSAAYALEQPSRGVPAEVALHDHLLKKQGHGGDGTHKSVRGQQYKNCGVREGRLLGIIYHKECKRNVTRRHNWRGAGGRLLTVGYCLPSREKVSLIISFVPSGFP